MLWLLVVSVALVRRAVHMSLHVLIRQAHSMPGSTWAKLGHMVASLLLCARFVALGLVLHAFVLALIGRFRGRHAYFIGPDAKCMC